MGIDTGPLIIGTGAAEIFERSHARRSSRPEADHFLAVTSFPINGPPCHGQAVPVTGV